MALPETEEDSCFLEFVMDGCYNTAVACNEKQERLSVRAA